MTNKSFRQLKHELEEVIIKLEAEDVDIDKATELYARAKELVAELEKQLTIKQATIKKISKK